MRPMPELKIEIVKTKDLIPYAGNAKLHTQVQVDQIAESIREFGNNDPIAVWHNESGGIEIVEGHGRLLALNKLGIEEVPAIFLDHLTDAQRRAYTHIHNQLTMNTGFDAEILREELSKITQVDMADLFGFDVGPRTEASGWDPEETEETGQSFEYDEYDDEEEDYESGPFGEPEGEGYADDVFNCLFVYHNEREAEKLCSILGVEELKPVYEIGELL